MKDNSPSNNKLKGYNSLHICFSLEMFNININFSPICYVQLRKLITCGLFYPILITTDYNNVRTTIKMNDAL